MIRPLKNQLLVEILPPDEASAGGVVIPESIREGSKDEKKPVLKGIVVAIGPWKTTKRGFSVLPDFFIGSTVVLSPYRGVQLGRRLGERMRMVKTEDVLAVLTPPDDPG
jgi:chaperonin GroES